LPKQTKATTGVAEIPLCTYKKKVRFKIKKDYISLIPFLIVISTLIFFSILVYGQPIENKDYKISLNQIVKSLKIGTFLEIPITISNYKDIPITASFSIDGDIKSLVKLDKKRIIIEPHSINNITVTIFGMNISSYAGSLLISGDIKEKIPINITVSEIVGKAVEALIMDIELLNKRVKIGDTLRYKIELQNIITGQKYNITLSHSIDNIGDKATYMFDKSFLTETENLYIDTTLSLLKEFEIPEFLKPGDYVINVKAEFLGLSSSTSRRFSVVEPIMDYLILGIIPIRWLLLGITICIIALIVFLIIRKKMAKKKRYISKIDYNTLPKPGPRSGYIGKIAETDKKAYFDLDQLTMHTLVAGSTGGGKTVSAEVLIEEALLKGVAVIVFDPTAQWTGFLRKCQEKKMLSLYPKFGMKKTDARAFNGNIHQVIDAREIIDIKKFIKPGEINVFSISKLDPEDIDILVANTIRQVFRANLPESSELKFVIIFDEVHRLLPKFGGSGEGFIQVERAAREFRKWGGGLILISQVLTDFVGETKANINTEIQMRTRDQGDLNRINNKYGSYMLQSLLKASTGTGMIENSAYNRGNPYFVSFRPLLHEHARLSDEELEQYNKYNAIIDDLEYQIEQLEKEGIDVFDLKLELKMALDKVKSGSFNMVNIYLESLTPRIKSQWERLGKQPKKREIKLVSEAELKAEFEKAKKAREKYEEEMKGKSTKKEEKGLKPLRLKNGLVVTNEQELIDSLNAMDDNIFKQHVNEEKNDFSEWLENINKELADKVNKAKTKQEVISILEQNKEQNK
jgi:hypothetical protein